MNIDEVVVMLQKQLENHIIECDKSRVEDRLMMKELLTGQAANTVALTKLTEQTKVMISVWQAGEGVVTVATLFGKFIKYLSGIAIVGVGMSWLIEKFT